MPSVSFEGAHDPTRLLPGMPGRPLARGLDDASQREDDTEEEEEEMEDVCRFDLRTRIQLLQLKLCPSAVPPKGSPKQPENQEPTRSHQHHRQDKCNENSPPQQQQQHQAPQLPARPTAGDSLSLASSFSSGGSSSSASSSSSDSSSDLSSGAPTPPPRFSSLAPSSRPSESFNLGPKGPQRPWRTSSMDLNQGGANGDDLDNTQSPMCGSGAAIVVANNNSGISDLDRHSPSSFVVHANSHQQQQLQRAPNKTTTTTTTTNAALSTGARSTTNGAPPEPERAHNSNLLSHPMGQHKHHHHHHHPLLAQNNDNDQQQRGNQTDRVGPSQSRPPLPRNDGAGQVELEAAARLQDAHLARFGQTAAAEESPLEKQLQQQQKLLLQGASRTTTVMKLESMNEIAQNDLRNKKFSQKKHQCEIGQTTATTITQPRPGRSASNNQVNARQIERAAAEEAKLATTTTTNHNYHPSLARRDDEQRLGAGWLSQRDLLAINANSSQQARQQQLQQTADNGGSLLKLNHANQSFCPMRRTRTPSPPLSLAGVAAINGSSNQLGGVGVTGSGSGSICLAPAARTEPPNTNRRPPQPVAEQLQFVVTAHCGSNGNLSSSAHQTALNGTAIDDNNGNNNRRLAPLLVKSGSAVADDGTQQQQQQMTSAPAQAGRPGCISYSQHRIERQLARDQSQFLGGGLQSGVSHRRQADCFQVAAQQQQQPPPPAPVANNYPVNQSRTGNVSTATRHNQLTTSPIGCNQQPLTLVADRISQRFGGDSGCTGSEPCLFGTTEATVAVPFCGGPSSSHHQGRPLLLPPGGAPPPPPPLTKAIKQQQLEMSQKMTTRVQQQQHQQLPYPPNCGNRPLPPLPAAAASQPDTPPPRPISKKPSSRQSLLGSISSASMSSISSSNSFTTANSPNLQSAKKSTLAAMAQPRQPATVCHVQQQQQQLQKISPDSVQLFVQEAPPSGGAGATIATRQEEQIGKLALHQDAEGGGAVPSTTTMGLHQQQQPGSNNNLLMMTQHLHQQQQQQPASVILNGHCRQSATTTNTTTAALGVRRASPAVENNDTQQQQQQQQQQQAHGWHMDQWPIGGEDERAFHQQQQAQQRQRLRWPDELEGGRLIAGASSSAIAGGDVIESSGSPPAVTSRRRPAPLNPKEEALCCEELGATETAAAAKGEADETADDMEKKEKNGEFKQRVSFGLLDRCGQAGLKADDDDFCKHDDESRSLASDRVEREPEPASTTNELSGPQASPSKDDTGRQVNEREAEQRETAHEEKEVTKTKEMEMTTSSTNATSRKLDTEEAAATTATGQPIDMAAANGRNGNNYNTTTTASSRQQQQVVAAVVERAINLHMTAAGVRQQQQQQSRTAAAGPAGVKPSLPTLQQVQRQMQAARAQLEQRQQQQRRHNEKLEQEKEQAKQHQQEQHNSDEQRTIMITQNKTLDATHGRQSTKALSCVSPSPLQPSNQQQQRPQEGEDIETGGDISSKICSNELYSSSSSLLSKNHSSNEPETTTGHHHQPSDQFNCSPDIRSLLGQNLNKSTPSTRVIQQQQATLSSQQSQPLTNISVRRQQDSLVGSSSISNSSSIHHRETAVCQNVDQNDKQNKYERENKNLKTPSHSRIQNHAITTETSTKQQTTTSSPMPELASPIRNCSAGVGHYGSGQSERSKISSHIQKSQMMKSPRGADSMLDTTTTIEPSRRPIMGEPVPSPRFQQQQQMNQGGALVTSTTTTTANSVADLKNELTISVTQGPGCPLMNQRIKDLSNELFQMNATNSSSSAQSTPNNSIMSDATNTTSSSSTTSTTTLLTEAEMNSSELIPKLIERLDRKLIVMKKEQFALMKEIEFNETSGQKLFETMRQQLTAAEFDKIQMHANEIEKVTKLILSLKLRLKRIESELSEQNEVNGGQQQQGRDSSTSSFLMNGSTTAQSVAHHTTTTTASSNADHNQHHHQTNSNQSAHEQTSQTFNFSTNCNVDVESSSSSASASPINQQHQQQQMLLSKQQQQSQRGLSDPTSTIGLPKRNHHQHHASLQSASLDECQASLASRGCGVGAKKLHHNHHHQGSSSPLSDHDDCNVFPRTGPVETDKGVEAVNSKTTASSTSSDSIFNCADSALGSCTITSSSSGHGGSSNHIEKQQQQQYHQAQDIGNADKHPSERERKASCETATISHSSLSSSVSTASSSSSTRSSLLSSQNHHHHHHNHHELSSPPPQSHLSSNISVSSHSSLSSVPSSPSLMSPTSTTSSSSNHQHNKDHHLIEPLHQSTSQRSNVSDLIDSFSKRDTNNNNKNNSDKNSSTIMSNTSGPTAITTCDSLMNLISDVDILMAKRNKLVSQLEEAHQLEECIAKRNNNIVERVLKKYYDEQQTDGEIALFRQFTKLKSLLLKDSHDINDRIENAEHQLMELRRTNHYSA